MVDGIVTVAGDPYDPAVVDVGHDGAPVDAEEACGPLRLKRHCALPEPGEAKSGGCLSGRRVPVIPGARGRATNTLRTRRRRCAWSPRPLGAPAHLARMPG